MLRKMVFIFYLLRGKFLVNSLFVYRYATVGIKRKEKEIVTTKKKMNSSDHCWKVAFPGMNNWLQGEKT